MRLRDHIESIIVAAIAGVILALFVAGFAKAAPPRDQLVEPEWQWHRVRDIEDVTVVLFDDTTDSELRSLYVRYHGAIPETVYVEGFSILRYYRGVWSCRVYLAKWADKETTLAHELKHCHGWSHQ